MEPMRRSKRLKRNNEQNKFCLKTDKRHPLLNGLILENIFGYLKVQGNSLTTLAHYRVVCKIWDDEITKFVRKDTQINLCNIVAPYPDGMGWTTTQDELETNFYYNVPYPKVRQFENVLVVADTNEKLINQTWIDWFQIMGSDVKRLCLSCPFNCFCQNHFLEQILKKWCPNLECLELRDIKGMESLLLESSFLHKERSLKCEGLKGLKISGDTKDMVKQTYCPCPEYDRRKKLTIALSFLKMSLLSVKLVQMFNEHGFSSNHSTPFSDSFTEIQAKDGGIVGQIMKQINLEKFVVCGFNDTLCSANLATFFYIRSNVWKSQSSLKHLELNECLSQFPTELYVIAQDKFSLSKIKLGALHLHGFDKRRMTRILSYFSNTLEHLEFSGTTVQGQTRDDPIEFILPDLPKLKTFIHENIVCCHLFGKNLWENAPNLETCRLEGSLISDRNINRFFENMTSVSCIAMKELKISARISGKQAEMLLNCFPNLLRMNLVLERIGYNSNGFFGKLRITRVKKLKISFFGYGNQVGEEKALGKGQMADLWKTGDIQGLEALELNNISDLSFCMTDKSFSGGNLTSLKLVKFRFFENDEKKNFLMGLSHIPSVQLINTV